PPSADCTVLQIFMIWRWRSISGVPCHHMPLVSLGGPRKMLGDQDHSQDRGRSSDQDRAEPGRAAALMTAWHGWRPYARSSRCVDFGPDVVCSSGSASGERAAL